jgi:hypothetical protein
VLNAILNSPIPFKKPMKKKKYLSFSAKSERKNTPSSGLQVEQAITEKKPGTFTNSFYMRFSQPETIIFL